VIAEKIKAFVYSANEGLIGMFFQSQRIQALIQTPDRLAVVPACSGQDQDIVHVADIEDIISFKLIIQGFQIQCN
jgi:hypothetical protein